MVGRWKGLATFWNNIKLPTIYSNHQFFGWKKNGAPIQVWILPINYVLMDSVKDFYHRTVFPKLTFLNIALILNNCRLVSLMADYWMLNSAMGDGEIFALFDFLMMVLCRKSTPNDSPYHSIMSTSPNSGHDSWFVIIDLSSNNVIDSCKWFVFSTNNLFLCIFS